MILLDLLPLGSRIFPVQLDINVRRMKLLRNVHLDTLVRSEHNLRSAIYLQELREDKPSRTRADEKHVDADSGSQLVHPVNRACRRFDEGGFDRGKVVDLVNFAIITGSREKDANALERAAYMDS